MAKNGFSMSNRVAVEALTAAKTLTADDCGKVFTVDAGGAISITLPSPGVAGAGWNTTIIASDVPGGNVTVAAGAALIHFVGVGSENTAVTDYPGSDGTAASNLILTTNAAKGDRIELVTDGSLWYGKTFAVDQNGITAS